MSAAKANSVHIYCRLRRTNLVSDALGSSAVKEPAYTRLPTLKRNYGSKSGGWGGAVRDKSWPVIDVQISMLH